MTHPLIVSAAKDLDKDRLTQFRIAQYTTAKEFSLQDHTILDDMRGVNIMVEKGESIIATMQIVETATAKDFEALTEIPLTENEVAFHSLYLGKAGTDIRYRNMGLNSLIRKYILEYALQQNQIRSFTASVYQSAPRLRLLERLGYSFRLISGNYPDYLTENECYLVQMRRENFTSALALANAELKELFNKNDIRFIPWW